MHDVHSLNIPYKRFLIQELFIYVHTLGPQIHNLISGSAVSG
jgi:hypothetical protein